MDTLDTLIANVLRWGFERGIIGPNAKATLLTQLSKTQEELTETRDAAITLNYLEDKSVLGDWIDAKEGVKDGIGDCTVTLILAAELAGLTFEDCLAHAYSVIKNRTGRMEGGQFIKDRPEFPANTLERDRGL